MKEDKRSERDLMIWLLTSIKRSGYDVKIRREENVIEWKFNGEVYEIRRLRENQL